MGALKTSKTWIGNTIMFMYRDLEGEGWLSHKDGCQQILSTFAGTVNVFPVGGACSEHSFSLSAPLTLRSQTFAEQSYLGTLAAMRAQFRA